MNIGLSPLVIDNVSPLSPKSSVINPLLLKTQTGEFTVLKSPTGVFYVYHWTFTVLGLWIVHLYCLLITLCTFLCYI